jgi:hypothetical protein
MQSLSECDVAKVIRKPGSKIFKFGGGETLRSIASCVIPAVIAGSEIRITTDVVESDIPLLLSLDAMKEARVKLDLENDTAEILGKTIALNHTSSGHYCLPIDRSAEVAIENACAVKLHELDEIDRRKTILKLHRQFAHPTEPKLVALMKDAGVWREEFQDCVRDIYDTCQLCKMYASTPARPVVAMPMAKNFNEKVAMDLKKWREKWILHLVDMWSRLRHDHEALGLSCLWCNGSYTFRQWR